MKYCKLIAVVLTIVILGIWVYLVYDINRAYPSPEEIIYKKNETFDYYGLDITPKNIDIYSYEELCKKYHGFENTVTKQEGEMFVIVTLHIKNTNTNKIETKDNPLSYWRLETGMETNGMEGELAYIVDYSSEIFNVGFEGDVEMPFSIYKRYLDGKSEEEILEQGIKIVADYYPYKKYILFQE